MHYWLFKSEPDVFGFADLEARPGRVTPWDGVRNYQARNYLRDAMQPGDLGLFYHSSCPEPGVAGVVRVAGPARPDPSAWDPASPYHDAGSSPEKPRWFMVDVAWHAALRRVVPLPVLRTDPVLREMVILRRGNRLSITPVTEEEFRQVCRLGGLRGIPRGGENAE